MHKLLATAKKGKQNIGTVVTSISVHITNNLTRGVGEFIARAETGIQIIYITRIMIGGDCANLLLNEKKNPFKIMLKSKNKQCTMDILLLNGKKEEFPVIANNNYYNIDKTKSLDSGLTYKHLTYKLKSIVVSPLVKA